MKREDWLQAGLAALAREGEPGVRIDRLAAELGVTRGSFHHHFDNAAAFRAALLETHEAEQAELLADAEQRVSELPATAAVEALMPLLGQIDLARERAVRAWAVSDRLAAEVVSRTDDRRFEMIQRIWRRALPVDDARTAALLPHLLLVGAITTGTSQEDTDAAFAMLTQSAQRLDPTDPAAATR